MDQWKRSFIDKLNNAQTRCAKRFEDALEQTVVPGFEEVAGFVRDHGFKVSSPLQERGRRSFKFELAENAYLLMIFRFTSVGEFELRCETFVPACQPVLRRYVGRIADVSVEWSREQFQVGLDAFVELLSGDGSPSAAAGASPAAPEAEPVEDLLNV